MLLGVLLTDVVALGTSGSIRQIFVYLKANEEMFQHTALKRTNEKKNKRKLRVRRNASV